jgi:hypothetical protein
MATRLEQFLADGVSNSSAILLQPLASLPPLELLRQYNVFLGVFQGLVSGALGAFFVKAERTGG